MIIKISNVAVYLTQCSLGLTPNSDSNRLPPFTVSLKYIMEHAWTKELKKMLSA